MKNTILDVIMCIIAFLCAIAFILSLACSPAHAEEQPAWKTTDKALMAAFVAEEVIATAQVRRAVQAGHNEDYGWGPKPSTAKVAATGAVIGLAVYGLADRFPEYRRALLIAANIAGAVVIKHNHAEVGVKFGF